MNPAPPLAPHLRHLAPALAAVVAQILANLRALVAARFRVPAIAPHANPLGGYITRTWRRFERLMARLAGGIPSRPNAPRAPRSPDPKTPRLKLPEGKSWLIHALPSEAAAFASQLQHQFNQPGQAELLAASPQAARLLRRLCHMLNLTFPGPPPQPRPRKPRAPKPDTTKPRAKPRPKFALRLWPAKIQA